MEFRIRRKADWFPFLIITAIAVDIEPIYVVFFDPPTYGPHGYMHTFLASIVMGAITGLLMYFARGLISEPLEGLGPSLHNDCHGGSKQCEAIEHL